MPKQLITPDNARELQAKGAEARSRNARRRKIEDDIVHQLQDAVVRLDDLADRQAAIIEALIQAQRENHS